MPLLFFISFSPILRTASALPAELSEWFQITKVPPDRGRRRPKPFVYLLAHLFPVTDKPQPVTPFIQKRDRQHDKLLCYSRVRLVPKRTLPCPHAQAVHKYIVSPILHAQIWCFQSRACDKTQRHHRLFQLQSASGIVFEVL